MFTFLGSHLAENLCFWINSAYSKEKFNEKILNGQFSRPFCSPSRNVEHWKCLANIFKYLLPMTLVKDYIFGSNYQKLGHALIPKLVSTDPLGF